MAKAAEWARRIQEWRASGLTRAQYAAGKGYSPVSLTWWSTKLKRDGLPAPSPVKMVQLVRSSAAVAEVAIDVSGARIVVRRGFDPALLRDVVAALGSR